MAIARGAILRGSGFAILWPQMAALAVLGSLILTLSALRFHSGWIDGCTGGKASVAPPRS